MKASQSKTPTPKAACKHCNHYDSCTTRLCTTLKDKIEKRAGVDFKRMTPPPSPPKPMPTSKNPGYKKHAIGKDYTCATDKDYTCAFANAIRKYVDTLTALSIFEEISTIFEKYGIHLEEFLKQFIEETKKR